MRVYIPRPSTFFLARKIALATVRGRLQRDGVSERCGSLRQDAKKAPTGGKGLRMIMSSFF